MKEPVPAPTDVGILVYLAGPRGVRSIVIYSQGSKRVRRRQKHIPYFSGVPFSDYMHNDAWQIGNDLYWKEAAASITDHTTGLRWEYWTRQQGT